MVSRVITGVQRVAHETLYEAIEWQGEIPRVPPVAAFDGQSFEALKKGLDTYSSDNDRLFDFVRETEIGVYTIRDASFLIGNGLDGLIVTDAGNFIEETAAFCEGIHNQSAQTPIDLPLSPIQFDTVTLCFDGAWHNYYHWILYGLGRADMLRRKLGASVSYVVPDYACRAAHRGIAFSHATYEGTLRLTDFYTDVLRLPPGQYRAKEIKFVWTEPRLPTDILNLKAFDGLFSMVREKVGFDNAAPARIYVSREHSPNARMSPEAISALNEISAEHGFTKVFLEKITFDEQVRLFRNAKQIVAPHGAGLANLMFAENAAQVLELNSELDSDGSLRACFYSICGLRDQPYMFLDGSKNAFTRERVGEAFARLFRSEG